MSSIDAKINNLSIPTTTITTTVFAGSELYYHGSPGFHNSDGCTDSHNASLPSRNVYIIKSDLARWP